MAAPNKDDCVNAFMNYAAQFSSSLSEAFTDCAATKTAATTIAMVKSDPGLSETFVTTFHDQMTEHNAYALCDKHDPAVFNIDVEILKSIDLHGKMTSPGTSDEVRDTVWQYIDLLTQHARVYAVYRSVPENMLQKVSGLAEELSRSAQTNGGQVDINSIAQKAMELSNNIDQDDLDKFRTSLMEDENLVPQVLGMIARSQQGK